MRSRWCLSVALAATGLLVAATPGPQAAPDNTLGMAILSAGIHTNGDVAFASGLQITSYVGTGRYQLYFDREISTCAQVVTPRSSGLSATISPTVDQNGVNVSVQRTSDGVLTDAPFHVIVFCNK